MCMGTPEGWEPLPYAKLKAMMKPEVRAAILVQSTFRQKLARRDVRAQRGKVAVASGSNDDANNHGGWAKMNDPASGNDYYYHTDGRVQWHMPDEW